MPEDVAALASVLLIAAVAVAIGIWFGIVIAPRIGRLAERADPEDPRDSPDTADEEPGDRPD